MVSLCKKNNAKMGINRIAIIPTHACNGTIEMKQKSFCTFRTAIFKDEFRSIQTSQPHLCCKLCIPETVFPSYDNISIMFY